MGKFYTLLHASLEDYDEHFNLISGREIDITPDYRFFFSVWKLILHI